MSEGSIYTNIWDRLKLERENPDLNRYYQGEKGRYLFLFEQSKSNPKRIGSVILNRKFLTALFLPKHLEQLKTWVGDNREKFLVFQEKEKNEIIIFWVDKKKKGGVS